MLSLQVRTMRDNVSHSDNELERWLLPAQRGDTEALYRLLTPHQRMLAAFCHKMLGNAEDAEDAAQETFLRAMRSLSGFRRDASFRTWLFRIALNICLDWKRARRPTESLDILPEHLSGTTETEPGAMNRLLVNEALDALMPRHRALLLLKEWAGWTAEEIAQAMHWKVRRVHNELFYARRALADWIERSGVNPSSGR
jgi:RNA polymerase sigma-70 factor, ECF subfamily